MLVTDYYKIQTGFSFSLLVKIPLYNGKRQNFLHKLMHATLGQRKQLNGSRCCLADGLMWAPKCGPQMWAPEIMHWR